mmetsp:Transcript_21634/g.31488  ORF Transcript_21634/g.31488 Transcript_21634/m.31488 type:complete len:173 (-) Transcript_21634:120-638(-)
MGYKRIPSASSGGLSTQLITDDTDSDPDIDTSIDFFIDLRVLYGLRGKYLEEANSHLILLEVTENDPSLRRSTLLDGRTIDFLFGNDVTRAFPAKQYIRCLHEEQQDMAVKFYHAVYDATMEYHSSLRGYGLCACCVTSNAKDILEEKLEHSYREFISTLAVLQNTGLIDDI